MTNVKYIKTWMKRMDSVADPYPEDCMKDEIRDLRTYAEQLERERDALRRDNLELTRVHDERGKQIERLDTALARGKSPQPVGAVVAGTSCTLTDSELADAEFVRGYIEEQNAILSDTMAELVNTRAAVAAQTPAQQSGGVVIEALRIGLECASDLLSDAPRSRVMEITKRINTIRSAIAAVPSPEAQGG